MDTFKACISTGMLLCILQFGHTADVHIPGLQDAIFQHTQIKENVHLQNQGMYFPTFSMPENDRLVVALITEREKLAGDHSRNPKAITPTPRRAATLITLTTLEQDKAHACSAVVNISVAGNRVQLGPFIRFKKPDEDLISFHRSLFAQLGQEIGKAWLADNKHLKKQAEVKP